MAGNRIARNEAWIVSLVLHVALLAGVIALTGGPRSAAHGPVVIDTRASGYEVGVVLLDRPAARTVPARPIALPVPVVAAPPVAPVDPQPMRRQRFKRWHTRNRRRPSR